MEIRTSFADPSIREEMMEIRTSFADPVPEESTSRYTAELTDETGQPIADTALDTLTLTLYERTSRTILNSLDHVDILNTGRGTVDGAGNLTILLEPDDNQILVPARTEEVHIMLIEWTFGTAGAKAGRHEVEFKVRNLSKVPSA